MLLFTKVHEELKRSSTLHTSKREPAKHGKHPTGGARNAKHVSWVMRKTVKKRAAYSEKFRKGRPNPRYLRGRRTRIGSLKLLSSNGISPCRLRSVSSSPPRSRRSRSFLFCTSFMRKKSLRSISSNSEMIYLIALAIFGCTRSRAR